MHVRRSLASSSAADNEHHAQWERCRNKTQAILATYGMGLFDALPDALQHMLVSFASRKGANLAHETFLFACSLNDVCARADDGKWHFPMGVDIAYARRILYNKAIMDEPVDMREQAHMLIDASYQARDVHVLDSGADRFAQVAPGRVGCAQIAFAYVFSKKIPSARIAQDLLLMRNDADCMKTLNEAAPRVDASSSMDLVHFGAGDLPELDMRAFKHRLERFKCDAPQLFMSALHTLQLMGPAFFTASTPMLKAPLPYEYAKKVEKEYTSALEPA